MNKWNMLAILVIGSGSVSGQNMTVSQPLATGVSSPLSSLRGNVALAPEQSAGLSLDRTAEAPADAASDEQGKEPRLGRTAGSTNDRIRTASVPSVTTPFQTTLNNLPVTVTKTIQGLGIGFSPTWTYTADRPDTTLAVGPNHLLQWVNTQLTVMDKNGTPLIGGADGYIFGNAIWAGLPLSSLCRSFNSGNPLVQYDRLVDRWILSQFASDFSSLGQPRPPFNRCIAVSTSGDPTGTFTLFEYSFGNLQPDATKLGVWPDAYYFTDNQYNGNTFVGGQVCAYDRAAMIAGLPSAAQVCFQNANRFSLLPSDLDGSNPPPAGSPNYVLSNNWAFNTPPYSLMLQKFHVDFVTPANSTLDDGQGGGNNSAIEIPLGTLIASCRDEGGRCVPQPGTARVLQTLFGMQPTYRLAYRNRGAGLESLVVTQMVDPPSTATASIQWMEIRNPGANLPQVFQSGAISTADGLNRWMGSGAMDKAGNIALGYSASSGTVFPGIRIAGRFRSDIRNTLRGELDVVPGSGSQTRLAEQWGFYSTMQVDPVDDCTFWYTNQYYPATSSFNWATKIIAFKFPSCN